MNDVVLVALIGLFAAPIAALVTWFVNRRKNVAEVKSTLTDMAQDAAAQAVETMRVTLKVVQQQLEDAEEKIDSLMAENKLLMVQMEKLKVQNDQLILENRSLGSKVDELLTVIEKLR